MTGVDSQRVTKGETEGEREGQYNLTSSTASTSLPFFVFSLPLFAVSWNRSGVSSRYVGNVALGFSGTFALANVKRRGKEEGENVTAGERRWERMDEIQRILIPLRSSWARGRLSSSSTRLRRCLRRRRSRRRRTRRQEVNRKPEHGPIAQRARD